ncbi:MAG: GNAT family N-acetyltransferase [Oscillospiraceae bacterium]|nr:GNAT family N-acetyltransferase [Oscillospiraceae bacterium]
MKYKLTPMAEEDFGYIEKKIQEVIQAADPGQIEKKEEEFVLKIENDAGEIIGGCIARLFCSDGGQMVLDTLWVREQHREQGIGSMLLCEAERIARELGCYISCLYTLDFQARGMYEKHGYAAFAVLEDRPRTHEVYAMSKRLDRVARDYVPKNHCADMPYIIKRGNEKDARMIAAGLKKHDDFFAPSLHGRIPLCRKLVDSRGNLVAGVIAGVDGWDGCYIADIYVEELYQKQGLGSFLLAEVEREAKKQGAYILLTNANDDNVGFFIRNGCSVAGVLKDFPKGHCSYELMKRL